MKYSTLNYPGYVGVKSVIFAEGSSSFEKNFTKWLKNMLTKQFFQRSS